MRLQREGGTTTHPLGPWEWWGERGKGGDETPASMADRCVSRAPAADGKNEHAGRRGLGATAGGGGLRTSPHSPPWGLGRWRPLRPTRNHPPLNPVPFSLSSAIQIGPGLTSPTILAACVQFSPRRDSFPKHETRVAVWLPRSKKHPQG